MDVKTQLSSMLTMSPSEQGRLSLRKAPEMTFGRAGVPGEVGYEDRAILPTNIVDREPGFVSGGSAE